MEFYTFERHLSPVKVLLSVPLPFHRPIHFNLVCVCVYICFLNTFSTVSSAFFFPSSPYINFCILYDSLSILLIFLGRCLFFLFVCLCLFFILLLLLLMMLILLLVLYFLFVLFLKRIGVVGNLFHIHFHPAMYLLREQRCVFHLRMRLMKAASPPNK